MNLGLCLGLSGSQGAGEVADQFLTQGATPGYFLDPSNVPASTSRITFRGTFTFAGSVPNLDKLFTQVSTGCDLETLSDGRLRAVVEDGTGAKMINSAVVAPSGSITADTEHSIVFDVDQVAETCTITIDGGTPVVTAFTSTSNGVFQSNRAVTFLALSGGSSSVPAGTLIKDLSVDFNGTLHKAISNDATEANADAWHQGGNFT